MVGALTVILLLSALVVSLLLERRRRRTAEIAAQKQHTALAHASRLAVAGELTAAIAHEINQPLGAAKPAPTPSNSFSKPEAIGAKSCYVSWAASEMTLSAPAKSSSGCALCLRGTKLGGSRSI